MNKKEVATLLKNIDGYYHGRLNTEDPMKMADSWYQVLQDEDCEKVNANLIRHVKASHFIPTISDLVKDSEARIRTTPNVVETQALLKAYEDRAKQPKDEKEIEKIQKEIREMLSIKSERV